MMAKLIGLTAFLSGALVLGAVPAKACPKNGRCPSPSSHWNSHDDDDDADDDDDEDDDDDDDDDGHRDNDRGPRPGSAHIRIHGKLLVRSNFGSPPPPS